MAAKKNLTPLQDRLLAKREIDEDGCWLFTGTVTSPSAKGNGGYGRIALGRASEGTDYVHRVAYRQFVGEIPEGWTVDHECHNRSDCNDGALCKHRRCFNPDHLVAKTYRDNILSSRNTVASKNVARTKARLEAELAAVIAAEAHASTLAPCGYPTQCGGCSDCDS